MFGLQDSVLGVRRAVDDLKDYLVRRENAEKETLRARVKALNSEIEQKEKELRETKHMIGLEKKRQEMEIESAKRDTQITVREEALREKQERFQQQMDFQRKALESHLKSQENLLTKIMERLPNINVELAGRSGR